ncbi:MAG: three-Cys-motif partner protein TcmP [Acidobacteria bacterium]|jgi:three-Cys-motif partner protein|nr:three-Cys-motif partner protein TcmP [Acidobacteriota bacterium]
MSDNPKAQFDEIGSWSEVKLEIIREYAVAYSRILSRQPSLEHFYIDAFAGRGVHISKTTGQFVLGSPLKALEVQPPFRGYFLIDLDGEKISALREAVGNRPDVRIREGDCNRILLDEVFPNVRKEQYRRALCLLDPYGLHLNWEVIQTAAAIRSIDMFLNFPVMDMNRNVLWRDPERVSPEDIARMNAFWGDESWRQIAYTATPTLFGPKDEKLPIEDIAEAFRSRLTEVAGFKRVPSPMPMKNSKGAIVYYLFFASQKLVAEKIAEHIFRKHG